MFDIPLPIPVLLTTFFITSVMHLVFIITGLSILIIIIRSKIQNEPIEIKRNVIILFVLSILVPLLIYGFYFAYSFLWWYEIYS